MRAAVIEARICRALLGPAKAALHPARVSLDTAGAAAFRNPARREPSPSFVQLGPGLKLGLPARVRV